MEKIINFRPLAQGLKNKDGKQIKENTILRSGEVSRATQGDIDKLAGFGVKYIYDFRSPEELKRLPSLSCTQFSTVHVDIVKEASPYMAENMLQLEPDEIMEMMKQLYGALFSTTDTYKTAIESIAAQDSDAFLYHCSAGKDRTGVFSAILMMAMDYNEDAIKEEYLRINAQQMGTLKAEMLHHMGLPGDTTQFDFMFTVRKEYLDAYLGAIMETHGSTDAYLKEILGVTEDNKQAFQEKYLV